MEIIENNFEDKVLNSKETCVVDFWAPWCGPCKIFEKTFEKSEKKFSTFSFYKLNVDSNKKAVKSLGILSIPTIIVFKGGKEIKRISGLLSESEFENFIK